MSRESNEANISPASDGPNASPASDEPNASRVSSAAHGSRVVTAAHRLLTVAVRGRRETGGRWGEAVLAEHEHVHGTWPAIRWAAGGLRVTWRERPARTRRRALAAMAAVLVVLAGGLTLRPGYQPSGAMQPTVPISGRYLLDKVGYRLTGLRHGDIVSIKLPGSGFQTIKRVIGLPGDRISCSGGSVFRDGVRLSESYLRSGTRTDCAPVTVQAGRLYLLGDNRAVSLDSRELGTLPSGSVDGRVLLTWG